MTEPDSLPQSGFIKLLIALVFINVVGYSGINVLPFVVGSWVDSGRFDLEATGLFGSAELGGMALASVGLAGLISRGRRRMWILTGVAAAVVGHGLSALDPGFEVMLVARATAGLGQGVLTATMMAIAAGSPDPTRLFAQLAAVAAVPFAVQIGVAPLIIQAFGTSGMFVTLAIMTSVIVPLAGWLPDTPGASAQAAAASPSPNRGLAILAISALALMAVGQMMVWTLSERMGVLAGLSAETVGVVLAVNNLMGLLGAATAVALGARLGHVPPTAFALAMFAGSGVVMFELNLPLPYVASNLAFGFAFALYSPYILGALASLDRAGRWTATAVGVQVIAAALGPVIGAMLASEGRRLVSLLIVVSTVIGFGMLMPTLRFADRSIEDPSVSGPSDA